MNKGGVRPLVIYGTGDTATLVYTIAIEAGIEVAAFTSDALDARMDTELPPFVAKSDLAKEFPPEQYDMAMGFIGKDLQKTREEKYCEMLNKGYRFPNVVQPGAHVSGMLGKGNIVMAGAVVGPRCSIADCNILWQNCVLSHDNEIGDFNNISPTASFSGYARAGSHCLIGNGAQLNNFVVVNDWALVGAGAYAREDVPTEAVLVPPRSYVLDGRKGIEFA